MQFIFLHCLKMVEKEELLRLFPCLASPNNYSGLGILCRMPYVRSIKNQRIKQKFDNHMHKTNVKQHKVYYCKIVI
jgi:hypothetical protein